MKNKKPLVALGALAVVGLVAGTIAYFTSQATFDNVFTTATYKTKSEETFTSPDNWTPGTTTPKSVLTTNEGNIPVAVRVSYNGQWYDNTFDKTKTIAENSEAMISAQDIAAVEASLPQGESIVTVNLTSGNDWIHQGNYYYYHESLLPDTTTSSSFMQSVTLNANLPVTSGCEVDTAQSTAGKTVKVCTTEITGLGKATYVLTILVETVQYDKYHEVWGAAPGVPDITEATPANNNNNNNEPEPGNGGGN